MSCQNYGQELEMIHIPSGNYSMGTNEYIFSSSGTADMLSDGDYRSHKVSITEFKISTYEISSEVFLEFLKDIGKNKFDYDDTYSLLLKYNGKDYFGYPAVSNYYYALDFCKWLSKKENKMFRLPTEAEWEYAATGGEDRIYPWGNVYQQLGSKDTKLQRVLLKEFNKDKSPFGVMNMYGNVAEWVLDYYQDEAYKKSPLENPIFIDGEQKSIDENYLYPPTYIVRGKNMYYYDLEMMDPNINSFATIRRRFPFWHRLFMYSKYDNIGFRIVEDLKNTELITTYGPVTYHYEIYKVNENAKIYLEPNSSSKIVKDINKDTSFQSSFIFSANNIDWLRIQTFENSEYKKDKKRGDDGVVGWIELRHCEMEK